jgi:hypothetical protein
VSPEVLYNDDYPYETGVNKDGVKHFRKLAEEIVSKCDLKIGDMVIDIGSNDGTLLESFMDLGMNVLGIEPIEEIAKKAIVPTVVGFFKKNADEPLISIFCERFGKAKIITATNVMAHIDDLHDFVEAVKILLADDGIFVMEAPYLSDMLNSVDFGQIYHEHLSYFGVEPLKRLFEMHDMKIINAEWQDVHGGSMRYYVGKNPQKSWLLKMGDDVTLERLKLFADNVWEFIEDFGDTLSGIKQEGKSIVGVSAPAKGNTVLNSIYAGKTDLDYITERSKKKIGKFTPGTHIEIVRDSKLIDDQPDFAVLFAHNWSRQIRNNLKDYKGEWITANEEGLKNFSVGWNRFGGECRKERATA